MPIEVIDKIKQKNNQKFKLMDAEDVVLKNGKDVETAINDLKVEGGGIDEIKTINNESLVGTGNIDLQVPLVSGSNIKTINGQSVLGNGNITIQTETDLTNYYNKTEVDSKFGNYFNKTEVESKLSTKQAVLVSGNNIKTVNGQSLVGSGNIQISQDLSNYYNKTEVDTKLNTKENKGTSYTKTETDTKLNTKQNKLVSGTSIKTINGQSLLGSGNIVVEDGGEVEFATEQDILNLFSFSHLHGHGNDENSSGGLGGK